MTTLRNGLILLLGGWPCTRGLPLSLNQTAELYDPQRDRWLWAASPHGSYEGHHGVGTGHTLSYPPTLTALLDGRALAIRSDLAAIFTFTTPELPPGQLFFPLTMAPARPAEGALHSPARPWPARW